MTSNEYSHTLVFSIYIEQMLLFFFCCMCINAEAVIQYVLILCYVKLTKENCIYTDQSQLT